MPLEGVVLKRAVREKVRKSKNKQRKRNMNNDKMLALKG